MFLNKRMLGIIFISLFAPVLTWANTTIDLRAYLVAGPYQLVSGPRELCGKLKVEEDEIRHPLFIGPSYNFSIENSLQRFPSENNKSCEMNRRNQVEKRGNGVLVLTYTREETCQAITKTQQRTQAFLTRGSIQISDSAPGEQPSTCVWKLRSESSKKKK